MVGGLIVAWSVVSTQSYSVVRQCARCDGPRIFESSGKFRLNANGKRLDAWLIYRCAACGRSWNRTLFERRAVDTVAPELLEALQSNDPARVAAFGFAFERAGAAFEIHKRRIRADPPPWRGLEIRMEAGRGAPRLDLVLARGLGQPRGRLALWAQEGRLCVASERKRALSKPVAAGMIVRATLDGLAEAAAIGEAAG